MFGTFFTISGDMVSSILGVIGNVFDDFKPLFLIIVGLSLGFFIIKIILVIVRGGKNKIEFDEDFDFEEEEDF